jgi:thiol:disulfide interchange protein
VTRSRSVLLTIFVVFFSTVLTAQDSLVHWKTAITKLNDSTYSLQADLDIARGWHLYDVNKPLEVEGLTFVFEEGLFAPLGAPVFSQPAQTIHDAVFEGKPAKVFTGSVRFTQQIRLLNRKAPELKLPVTAYLGRDNEFVTAEHLIQLPLQPGGSTVNTGNTLRLTGIDLAKPVANCGDDDAISKTGTGILTVFLLGFIGGFIALLTPCVFPLIPVTVSFFTKKSKTRADAIRNGVLYGFFIFAIYTLLSIPFHVVDKVSSDVLNNISTNAWLNVFFFAIFIVFAISFFGFFEITLPSGIASKADSKGSLGSTGGIFFMALTLVIVSFSCTGIILSSLMVGVASNGAWPLTAGLAGFGMALALPFALFAIFPHWLQSLPKSGGWLDTVKKVLAFAELALALKFLSGADLVMHWGLLSRELFVVLWIVIALGLSLYLFGILRLPHDYKGQKIGKGRKLLGVLAVAFTLYLGLGLANVVSLRMLSGILPPEKHNAAKNNIILNDYAKAVELAKAQHKPVLIDFTGWACTNCRRMEENVWSRPEVHAYMQENFVLVSLYVDDRAKLPVEERMTYTKKDGSRKAIETVGDKWITFEEENFNQVAQPLYVIVSPDGRLLNKPKAYTPDAAEYLSWLQCGREAMER